MTVCTNALPVRGLVVACPCGSAAGWPRLFRSPCWRPTKRWPPPSGMLPNLVTSTWISEPGVRVLVAAHRLAGDPVDVAEPVDPAPHQHRVDRRGRDAELAADLNRAEPVAPPQPHDLAHHGRAVFGRAAARPARAISHPGRPFGPVPSRPTCVAVTAETMNIFAATGGVQPSSTTSRASRRRAARGQRSVSVGHEGLLVREAVPRQLHSTTGGLHLSSRLSAVSRNNLPGHHT